ncbi:MAG TPA: hypothetical protein VHX20_11725 [Terracidiphilus sp.]|jgi:hypothetical protein|nr:hypothetical protein [Terracidiphilus sp.]
MQPSILATNATIETIGYLSRLRWPGFHMHYTDPTDAREAHLAEIASSEQDSAALKEHLKEIIEGKAFRGSARSIRFLEYILDQAIAGHFEALKERVIGVELFGRSPSYETGEDSIVRVAAGDVRKRLSQHYSIYGTVSEFHLSLPLGSYILEITRHPPDVRDLLAVTNAHNKLAISSSEPVANHHESATISQEQSVVPILVSPSESMRTGQLNWRLWIYFGILLVAASVAQWGILLNHYSHEGNQRGLVLPWSAFFNSSHSTVLVTSDPNIAEIQILAGRTISTSDYANHRYIPEPNALTPEQIQFCKQFLIGDKAASVDPPIVANIAQLAQSASKKIEVRGARDVELSNLHTDDNFIFLGSPGSDPWVNLFSSQLDFRFGANGSAGLDQTVVNTHPSAHELPLYVPTAPGYATGQSFAIIAFVQNPDQNGQVLILAGASREGTEAAGKFVVDLPRFSKALQNCGIKPSGPLRHFEMLLRVNIMAGLPNRSDVAACHILYGSSV